MPPSQVVHGIDAAQFDGGGVVPGVAQADAGEVDAGEGADPQAVGLAVGGGAEAAPVRRAWLAPPFR